jgi:hypothetical protein
MTHEEACQALEELQTRLKFDIAPLLTKLPHKEVQNYPGIQRLKRHLAAIDHAIAVIKETVTMSKRAIIQKKLNSATEQDRGMGEWE